jgi:hypothetical protein
MAALRADHHHPTSSCSTSGSLTCRVGRRPSPRQVLTRRGDPVSSGDRRGVRAGGTRGRREGFVAKADLTVAAPRDLADGPGRCRWLVHPVLRGRKNEHSAVPPAEPSRFSFEKMLET